MPDSLSFDGSEVHIQSGSQDLLAAPSDDVPFRIVILGDFSGRTGESRESPATARPILVDRDNFDDIFQSLKVEVVLSEEADAKRPLALHFASLEDFHPDQIFKQATLFQGLRELKNRLSSSATYAEAAAQVKRLLGKTEPSVSAEAQRETEADSDPNRISVDFLLEGLSSRSQRTAASASFTGDPESWNALLHQIVAPHLLPRQDPQQAEMIGLIDLAISTVMREILHHPGFQAVEAAWRGLHFLTSQLETGSNLKLYLLDISKEELAADLGAAKTVSDTVLFKLLVQASSGQPDADPWALLVGNYVFDASAQDVQTLIRLAATTVKVGAPFLASASPAVVGTTFSAAAPDPDDWILPEENSDWTRLRQSQLASLLGLILPRFLLRIPYGKKSDPIDSFAFEEMEAVPQHEQYLWGNGAFLGTYVLGRAFSEFGWKLSEAMNCDVDGLSLHTFEEQGGSVVKPCAEVLLSQRAAERLLDQGLMPLLSFKGQDRVSLWRFQSIADPSTPLSGRWE